MGKLLILVFGICVVIGAAGIKEFFFPADASAGESALSDSVRSGVLPVVSSPARHGDSVPLPFGGASPWVERDEGWLETFVPVSWCGGGRACVRSSAGVFRVGDVIQCGEVLTVSTSLIVMRGHDGIMLRVRLVRSAPHSGNANVEPIVPRGTIKDAVNPGPSADELGWENK